MSASTAAPTGICAPKNGSSDDPSATSTTTTTNVSAVFATSKAVTVPSRSSTESGIIIVACVFTSSTPMPPSTVPQNMVRS